MTFTIMFDESIGRGGQVSIIIPDETDINASELNLPLSFNSGDISCSIQGSSHTLKSCSSPNSKQIDLIFDSQNFVLSGDSVTFVLTNACTNPSSLHYLTKSLSVKTLNSYGIQIEQKTDSIYLQSLKPAQITEQSLVYGSKMLGAQSSTLDIHFTVPHAIPYLGKIQLSFPQRLTVQDTDQGFIPSNYSLTKCQINGADLKVDNHTLVSAKLDKGQILTISDFIQSSQYISKGALVHIQISGFNNPVKLNQTGLVITTFDNFGSTIDQSSELMFNVTIPAQINTFRVLKNVGSSIINRNAGFNIEFESPLPLDSGCILRLKIPDELTNNLYQRVKYVYVDGMFGATRSLQFSIQNNTVLINGACMSFVSNQVAGTIKIKYLQNPNKVKDTGNFELSFLDAQQNILATNIGSFGDNSKIKMQDLKAAAMTSVHIISQNQTISSQNDLMFQIKLKNFIENPVIKISVPNTIYLQDSCKFIAFSKDIQSENATCSINSRQITVGNFVSSNFSVESPILIFKITSVFKNPLTAISNIGEFTIQSYSENYLVDEIVITDPFTIDPGQLFNPVINFSPNKNYMVDPITTMMFKPQHTIVSGSNVIIEVPSEELTLMTSPTCTGLYFKTNCTIKGNKIHLKTNENINAFTQVNLNITHAFQTTPRFQGTMKFPFQIAVFISGQKVDQSNKFKAEIGQLRENKCTLKLTNKVNLHSTSILVSIKESIPVLPTDYLILQIPENSFLIRNSSLKCIAPLNCTSSQNGIKITGLSTENMNDFEIKGLFNPQSTKKVFPIDLAHYDINNRLVQKCDQAMSLQTNQASDTTQVRIIQASTQPSGISDYTLVIEKNFNKNELPWVKLTLPDCVRYGERIQILDHTSNTHLNFTQFSSYDFVFKLHEGINFLTFQNLRNPSVSCMYRSTRLSFEYRSYEDQDLTYKLNQRLTGMQPVLSCKSTCATCKGVDKSFCTSCNDELQSLLTDTGTCIANTTCPTKYYQKSQAQINKKCYKCQTGCNSCFDGNGVCSQCSAGWVLNKTDSVCILNDKCKQSQGYINTGDGSCHKCSDQCEQCTSSPLTCSICKDKNNFLHQGQCLQECPEGFRGKKRNNTQSQCILLSKQSSTVSNFLSVSTKVVINQENPVIYIAHFPTLILYLLIIFFKKCHQTGRSKLSNREIMILGLGSSELIATVILLLKCFLSMMLVNEAYSQIIIFDDEQDTQLINPDQKPYINEFFLIIVLLMVFYFVIQTCINECFYRQFKAIWETNIKEDFVEEFTVASSSCFCNCETLTYMRYFNYREWICLWKKKGWIIPDEQQLTRDQICLTFVKLSKKTIVFLVYFKYSVLLICIYYLKVQSNPNAIMVKAPSVDTTVAQAQKYRQYIETINFIQDFIANQLTELTILGLASTVLFSRWLLGGYIELLSEDWEFNSDSSSSSSSSIQTEPSESQEQSPKPSFIKPSLKKEKEEIKDQSNCWEVKQSSVVDQSVMQLNNNSSILSDITDKQEDINEKQYIVNQSQKLSNGLNESKQIHQSRIEKQTKQVSIHSIFSSHSSFDNSSSESIPTTKQPKEKRVQFIDSSQGSKYSNNNLQTINRLQAKQLISEGNQLSDDNNQKTINTLQAKQLVSEANQMSFSSSLNSDYQAALQQSKNQKAEQFVNLTVVSRSMSLCSDETIKDYSKF